MAAVDTGELHTETMTHGEFHKTKANGATTKGKVAESSQLLKGGMNTHFRPPKIFTVSIDFELCRKGFESYLNCVGLPNAEKGNAF